MADQSAEEYDDWALRAAWDTREEPCEFCENGWAEGRPIPTPDGPQYPVSRCIACGGSGWVFVQRQPVDPEDMDDPYGAFAYRGGNP